MITRCTECGLTLETQEPTPAEFLCTLCRRRMLGFPEREALKIEPHLVEGKTACRVVARERFSPVELWIPMQCTGFYVRQIYAGDLALMVSDVGVPVEVLGELSNMPAILWPTLAAGDVVTFELEGDGKRRSFAGAFLGPR